MNVRRLSAVKRVAHRSSIKIVTGNLESKSFFAHSIETYTQHSQPLTKLKNILFIYKIITFLKKHVKSLKKLSIFFPFRREI